MDRPFEHDVPVLFVDKIGPERRLKVSCIKEGPEEFDSAVIMTIHAVPCVGHSPGQLFGGDVGVADHDIFPVVVLPVVGEVAAGDPTLFGHAAGQFGAGVGG